MINIVGDVIEFNGRPVALIIVPSGTLRDRFEEAIRGDVHEEEIGRLNTKLEQIKELYD